jgi:hypothetical protein
MSKQYIFIDESGEIDFYTKKGKPLWENVDYKPFTLLGMIVTNQRKRLRKDLEKLREEILGNHLFNQIHSVKTNPKYFFHARADHSDIKVKVFEFLQSIDYVSFYVVIGRKIPEIFQKKHHNKTQEFYFDLVNKLIGCLDVEGNTSYQLFLAQRQSSTERRFAGAVEKVFAKQPLTKKVKYKCDIIKASEYPELSLIDYALWALHRYLDKGDDRFFGAIKDKFKVIFDIYDDSAENPIYDLGNPFDINKAKPYK